MIKECVDIQVAGASSPAHTEARSLGSILSFPILRWYDERAACPWERSWRAWRATVDGAQ